MIDEKDIRKAATLTYNPALDAVANFSARNAFAAGVDLTSSLKKHVFYNLLINNILYLCVT